MQAITAPSTCEHILSVCTCQCSEHWGSTYPKARLYVLLQLQHNACTRFTRETRQPPPPTAQNIIKSRLWLPYVQAYRMPLLQMPRSLVQMHNECTNPACTEGANQRNPSMNTHKTAAPPRPSQPHVNLQARWVCACDGSHLQNTQRHLRTVMHAPCM